MPGTGLKGITRTFDVRGTGGRRVFFSLVVFLTLVALACMPVWSVTYFFSQDGPAHLHSASMIFELLSSPAEGTFYRLNSIVVPNSLAHWLMAILLLGMSPFAASKATVTIIYALFVAGVGWLRFAVHRESGLWLSLLMGGTLGLNLPLLIGFYNYLLGLVLFMATLGWIYYWRGEINAKRGILLSGLFIGAYVAHLVSFAILAMSATLFVSLSSRVTRLRSFSWLLAAFLPVLPLAVFYRFLSGSEAVFIPSWYILNEPINLSGVLLHLHAADPFIILGRRYLPFTDVESGAYAVFSPVVWVLFSFSILAIGTFWRDKFAEGLKRYFPHDIVILAVIFLAVISPDELGPLSGSMIRPRILLTALILLVPLFDLSGKILLRGISIAILVGVFAFQVAALWEYSLRSDREIAEYLSVTETVRPGESLGSITIVTGPRRFGSNPVRAMDNIVGIQRNSIVWDNYETGHYLFPVMAARREDRLFIREFSVHNIFRIGTEEEQLDQRMANLSALLEKDGHKIGTMIVWGRDLRVESMLERWFESRPNFEHGRVRLYRKVSAVEPGSISTY